MKNKTRRLTKIALVAALLCVISPFAITFPFSPVPISLATLMLYLSVYIVGKRDAVISCGIYLLIGLVGIPVFSGFTGGIGKVLGPTGGYMIGYLFLTYISGFFWEKCNKAKMCEKSRFDKGEKDYDNRNRGKNGIYYLMQSLGMVLGTAVCYLFGSLWLSYQAGVELHAALNIGVFPFIPGDVVKIAAGVVLGTAVRRRLVKAGII